MLKGALLCNERKLLQCCLQTYDPGGRALVLFLRPHSQEFAIQEKKMLMPRGLAGGGGEGAAGIDQCITNTP